MYPSPCWARWRHPGAATLLPSTRRSQFGKLVVATGNRILGDVTVAISGAVFLTNQFGAVAITFDGGTSGRSLDASNSLASGRLRRVGLQGEPARFCEPTRA